MNVNLRAADSWFLLRNPVRLPYSTIASTFIGVGILLILAEALFFDYFSAFAHSSFTTRRIIGYHLFFSELWFIVVGNALLFLVIGNRSFLVPRYLVIESRPVFLTLGVYSLWFVYGSISGNPWALQEFREMVLAALSLPPILYFASMLNARQVLEKFILPGTLVLLAASTFQVGAATLMLGSFFVSYFTLRMLYKTYWASIGLGLAALPFLLSFAKPMIALMAFCVAASFLIAGYLNQKSVNWILSKFKIKIVLVGLSILTALLGVIALINAWSGGAIEEIVRWYFLKERLTTSGETFYGDISGGRFAIWLAALESWVQHPIVGHGLGAEVEAYSSGWVTKTQYHNYLVQALHNTGLVGFTLIVGGWSVWLRRNVRKVALVRDTNEKIVLAGMLVYIFGIFFYGLYGHSFGSPPTTLFFWLCVGFLCAWRPPAHHGMQS